MSNGIVFSGGGAYGAYEAGVLKYLAEKFVTPSGQSPFQYVSGTSVGAFHAALAGASAHDLRAGVDRIVSIWENFDINEIVQFKLGKLWSVIRGEMYDGGSLFGQTVTGLLDTKFIERDVLPAIPWLHLGRNIRSRLIHGIAVAATRVSDGRTTVFYDTADGRQIALSNDPRTVSERTRLGPRHVLASAALPLAFPPVTIGQQEYADGSIRLNTPLAPMLRFGADSIVIVRLHQSAHKAAPQVEEGKSSNLFYLIGRLLQALMMESLDIEIARLRMYNDILTTGGEKFGQQFVEDFNHIMVEHRGVAMKPVRFHCVEPSVPLGAVAQDVVKSIRFPSGMTRRLFDWMRGGATRDTNLLGFLLFDGRFGRELVRLGYEDARAQHAQLESLILGVAPY